MQKTQSGATEQLKELFWELQGFSAVPVFFLQVEKILYLIVSRSSILKTVTKNSLKGSPKALY